MGKVFMIEKNIKLIGIREENSKFAEIFVEVEGTTHSRVLVDEDIFITSDENTRSMASTYQELIYDLFEGNNR